MKSKASTEKTQLKGRWASHEFRLAIEPELKKFVKTRMLSDIDLRGGVFGNTKGASPLLQSTHFNEARIKGVRFCFTRFACPFYDAEIDDSDFGECLFDDCQLIGAKVRNCNFTSATMTVSCDDARIEKCNFTAAAIKGSLTKGHGGRRASFYNCDFRDAQFKGVEFRACRFVDCNFAGAHFFGCSIHHPKFEGMAPSHSQFTDVNLVGELAECIKKLIEE